MDEKYHYVEMILAKDSDVVKFVICTLIVSRVHSMFYILTKGYTVPENQGADDKLNQIRSFE